MRVERCGLLSRLSWTSVVKHLECYGLSLSVSGMRCSVLLALLLIVGAAICAEDTPFKLLTQIEERHVAVQQQVATAVVEVQSFGARIDNDKPCYGTGVVISADGLILSANTCVPAGAESVKVTFPDGRILTASLLDYDPTTEVRLLKVT